jgi:hypothetical protein
LARIEGPQIPADKSPNWLRPRRRLVPEDPFSASSNGPKPALPGAFAQGSPCGRASVVGDMSPTWPFARYHRVMASAVWPRHAHHWTRLPAAFGGIQGKVPWSNRGILMEIPQPDCEGLAARRTIPPGRSVARRQAGAGGSCHLTQHALRVSAGSRRPSYRGRLRLMSSAIPVAERGAYGDRLPAPSGRIIRPRSQ